MEKNQKKRWPLSRFLTFIWVVIFIYSAYQLSALFLGYYDNRKTLKEAQNLFSANHLEKAHAADNKTRFDDLLQINEDIVGWINVPNTSIDYPILQGKDNDFYLERNYKQNPERAGSIFMDYRNDAVKLGENTILYGHRMKDGSMFGHLKKYLNQGFYDENPVFQFDTLAGSYEVEVFSAYTTTAGFDYIQTEFADDEEWKQFISTIKEKSSIKTDTEVKGNILTLSTCDYMLDSNEGRLVVHGVIHPAE